jgi:hypothetical protein
LVILVVQPVSSLIDISDQLSYADAVTSQDQVDDGIGEEFLQRRFHASFSVRMRHCRLPSVIGDWKRSTAATWQDDGIARARSRDAEQYCRGYGVGRWFALGRAGRGWAQGR